MYIKTGDILGLKDLFRARVGEALPGNLGVLAGAVLTQVERAANKPQQPAPPPAAPIPQSDVIILGPAPVAPSQPVAVPAKRDEPVFIEDGMDRPASDTPPPPSKPAMTPQEGREIGNAAGGVIADMTRARPEVRDAIIRTTGGLGALRAGEGITQQVAPVTNNIQASMTQAATSIGVSEPAARLLGALAGLLSGKVTTYAQQSERPGYVPPIAAGTENQDKWDRRIAAGFQRTADDGATAQQRQQIQQAQTVEAAAPQEQLLSRHRAFSFDSSQ